MRTVTFDDWLNDAPERLKRDPLWRRADYRLATFVGRLAIADIEQLIRHPAMKSLSDQLFRAVGSITANIAEGYSRGGGPDRARFYEYALGSAREAREWYRNSGSVLGEEALTTRDHALEQIVRLLLAAIKAERGCRRR